MINQQKIYGLRKRIVAIDSFDQADWIAIGDRTDCQHIIENHPRLLRSLDFGDTDYPSAVGAVLKSMYTYQRHAIDDVISFLDEHFPEPNTVSVSTSPTSSTKKVFFIPTIFELPDSEVESDLVSIMMPFAGFDGVHQGIIKACTNAGYRCQRCFSR
ncbi:hypothetical protein [Shewanella psychromarinicola]|uniref:hypothetical protein n=1 Tax=Shewanella psychromarinicola TaxID=2487742 RepID=UPI0013E28714|nr:hypothetical protein [Shewanella psychromarinicola]MCL1084436.1 hypothetical protein [Shewanella psychromarinicola]